MDEMIEMHGFGGMSPYPTPPFLKKMVLTEIANLEQIYVCCNLSRA